MSVKTVVIGASENPQRYSNKAIEMLRHYGHEVVGIGNTAGIVGDVSIFVGQPEIKDVDTITLYLSPKNQTSLYQYLLSLRPRRMIFNPGAENPEFENMAQSAGIDVQRACTLVLLSTGQY